MSSTTYPHPSDFRTDTEPTLDAGNDRVQYDFDTLLARRRGVYVFVDYIFDTRRSELQGAVGTRMRPVHEKEAERKREEYHDYEASPLRWLYDEQSPALSWDEWIESQFRQEGLRVIYDTSYAVKYGEIVEEKAHEEGVMEAGEIALVECIGGGRMFNEVDQDHDVVYDDELLRLVREAEQENVANLY